MSKTRDTGNIGNIVRVDASGNVSFVSGSTTLATINTSGQLSGSSPVLSSSYASNAETLDGLDSTVFTLTSSFIAQTASFTAFTASINAFSASQNSFTASILAQTASLNTFSASVLTYQTNLNLKTASFATTGSNNFTAVQHIADTTNPTGFDTTASLYTEGGLGIKKDSYFSSSLYIKGNLTVYGTQSVSYITSSQLNISTNLITVNTATPSVRFGGIAVQDSGSTSGLTGSLLWDSQNNSWLYNNPSGSGNYDSAMVIMGPRNSSALGSEVGLSCNYLVQGHGHHHTTSSAIFHDGTTTCLPGVVCAPNYISTNCYLFNYSQSTVRSIWGGGYGGVVQLTSDNATSARYARIGISDSTNVWQGGMTISGADNSANFTGTGVFNDSISVAASTGGSSTFWGNLCISNNKCAYFSGNVGIGNITNTYAKLVINQDGSSSANSVGVGCPPGLKIYADAGIAPFMVMSQTARGTMTMGLQAAASIPANFVLGLDVCGDIIFKNQMSSYCDLSTGTSLLFICRNGTVGIGTSSPATTSGKGLHIYSTYGHANLSLESSTSGVKWEILSTTSCNFVVYQAGGGGDRFTIAPNGITTFACRVCISVGRTNGADSTALIFQDNVTGVQTPGFGLRLTYQSNGTGVQSVIGLENGGTGTNNESQISFYTQNTAGGLGKRLLLTSGGDAGFSGNVCAGCINLYNGAMTSNSVITYSVGGTMAGYSATYYDFPVWNDTDQGQMIEVKAFFDHFYNWNYGTHYYIYLTSRATSTQALTMFNCTTVYGGSWMAYKPNATTLRVCKIAGTYGGGGAFWIQVTSKQP